MKKRKITTLTALVGVLVIAIFSLVINNTRDLIFGSPLVIKAVKDGATLSEGFLPISGVARHARSVLINGRDTLLDRDGNFADGVILSPGYNIVEIATKDKFGKEKTEILHLVFDEHPAVASASQDVESY